MKQTLSQKFDHLEHILTAISDYNNIYKYRIEKYPEELSFVIAQIPLSQSNSHWSGKNIEIPYADIDIAIKRWSSTLKYCIDNGTENIKD